MKITFVTLMAHPGSKQINAIVYTPDTGMFNGRGNTIAEALEAAFTEFRFATLPEALKQYARPSGNADELCRGCGRQRSLHVNNTLCTESVHRNDIHSWLASSNDYTPCCAAIIVTEDGGEALCGQHPTARIHRCHGCGHLPQNHPNDTGCEKWHAKP